MPEPPRPAATFPRMTGIVRKALTLQAGYYIVTGIWPVLHMASFEAITGPKTDDWLVRMVGLLAAAIGLTLAVALKGGRWTPEVKTLAIMSALAFAAIDIRYALPGRISAIYLADAAVELVLVAVYLFARPGAGREAAS